MGLFLDNIKRNPVLVTVVGKYSSVGKADTGTYILKASNGTDLVIPKNAIIYEIVANVKTAVTSSGSATISLGYEGANTAFLDAEAKTSFDATTKIKDTAVAKVKLSSAKKANITIGGAALTAGALEVIITYAVVV